MHLELDYEALITQDRQSSHLRLSEIMHYNPAVLRYSQSRQQRHYRSPHTQTSQLASNVINRISPIKQLLIFHLDFYTGLVSNVETMYFTNENGRPMFFKAMTYDNKYLFITTGKSLIYTLSWLAGGWRSISYSLKQLHSSKMFLIIAVSM